MARYSVTIPIAGYAVVEVEAANAEAAKLEAFNIISFEHIESWEGFEQISRGNVLYAPKNRVEVDEIEAAE